MSDVTPQLTPAEADRELARQLHAENVQSAVRQRFWLAVATGVFGALGTLTLVYQVYALAWVTFGASLVSLLFLFDAHGQLQEIRDRTPHALAPRLSKALRRSADSKPKSSSIADTSQQG